MKQLLEDVKKLHVNYEVLSAAILHLSEEEQVKVNKQIIQNLGLPLAATPQSIQHERQIKVDDVSDYDGILDAFILLKKVVEEPNEEVLAEAQMFIASIKDDR